MVSMQLQEWMWWCRPYILDAQLTSGVWSQPRIVIVSQWWGGVDDHYPTDTINVADYGFVVETISQLMLGVVCLIVLGFNDTSTLEGHFVSSPREREKRDRRESRGDEREGQGGKKNRNESEETEEIKTFPLYPYPLQG